MTVRFPRIIEGKTKWAEETNVADDNDTHFPIIGEKFVASGQAKLGTIGEAPATFFSMRALVSFALGYFEAVL